MEQDLSFLLAFANDATSSTIESVPLLRSHDNPLSSNPISTPMKEAEKSNPPPQKSTSEPQMNPSEFFKYIKRSSDALYRKMASDRTISGEPKSKLVEIVKDQSLQVGTVQNLPATQEATPVRPAFQEALLKMTPIAFNKPPPPNLDNSNKIEKAPLSNSPHLNHWKNISKPLPPTNTTLTPRKSRFSDITTQPSAPMQDVLNMKIEGLTARGAFQEQITSQESVLSQGNSSDFIKTEASNNISASEQQPEEANCLLSKEMAMTKDSVLSKETTWSETTIEDTNHHKPENVHQEEFSSVNPSQIDVGKVNNVIEIVADDEVEEIKVVKPEKPLKPSTPEKSEISTTVSSFEEAKSTSTFRLQGLIKENLQKSAITEELPPIITKEPEMKEEKPVKSNLYCAFLTTEPPQIQLSIDLKPKQVEAQLTLTLFNPLDNSSAIIEDRPIKKVRKTFTEPANQLAEPPLQSNLSYLSTSTTQSLDCLQQQSLDYPQQQSMDYPQQESFPPLSKIERKKRSRSRFSDFPGIENSKTHFLKELNQKLQEQEFQNHHPPSKPSRFSSIESPINEGYQQIKDASANMDASLENEESIEVIEIENLNFHVLDDEIIFEKKQPGLTHQKDDQDELQYNFRTNMALYNLMFKIDPLQIQGYPL